MADVLRAPGLSRAGFVHGFSLRTGGASQGPFESLNLGRAVGDDAASVEENLRRFADAVGLPEDSIFELSQVHGRRVRRVFAGEDPRQVRAEPGDALVAGAGGLVVGVRVADCLAVLLADTRSGAVAAVHAGWRGLVRGALAEAVESLARLAAGPLELRAAVFPHIRACCFEVGDEVAAELEACAPGAGVVVARAAAKPHADLSRLAGLQLGALGVQAAALEDLPGCTRCDAARFFSYRRDGQRSGRHLAVIRSAG
jgi:YfiH family protein